MYTIPLPLEVGLFRFSSSIQCPLTSELRPPRPRSGLTWTEQDQHFLPGHIPGQTSCPDPSNNGGNTQRGFCPNICTDHMGKLLVDHHHSEIIWNLNFQLEPEERVYFPVGYSLPWMKRFSHSLHTCRLKVRKWAGLISAKLQLTTQLKRSLN